MEESRRLRTSIYSLRQHWPARKTEWLMAGVLASWGLYTLLNPAMFYVESSRVILSGMVSISDQFTPHPALFWGGIAFVCGSGRALALLVNGAWTRTPLIRVIASFVSMFIFTQIVVGLWQSGVPNTGLVVYPWFVIADLLSAYQAAVDVVHAEKQREVEKETRRDARRHRSIVA